MKNHGRPETPEEVKVDVESRLDIFEGAVRRLTEIGMRRPKAMELAGELVGLSVSPMDCMPPPDVFDQITKESAKLESLGVRRSRAATIACEFLFGDGLREDDFVPENSRPLRAVN